MNFVNTFVVPSPYCFVFLVSHSRSVYSSVDTIQDFLFNLGMKPHMHLVEISSFSLNLGIVRPTKIIKDLRKAST